MWCGCFVLFVFFFKQKTAYEMRISDWSSDVCSSDLADHHDAVQRRPAHVVAGDEDAADVDIDLAGGKRAQSCFGVRHLDQLEAGCLAAQVLGRSEERRVGKGCVSTCRSRWLPYH